MDAGLGIKAYAVIEQGKIGQILSARPTDRRQLIEEAAGVTKYKSRRRSAELKLEAAQQNLTRVDDIIFEVEKQRGALKRQAAKARRYKRLREELRRWEKVQFAQRYRLLGEAIEAARATARRRARARDGGGRAPRGGRDDARAAAARADRGGQRGRRRRAKRRTRASCRSGGCSSRSRSTSSRSRRSARRRRRIEAEIEALEARREPARVELDERRAAAARATGERDAGRRTLLRRRKRRTRPRSGTIEGLEVGRRGGAQRGVRRRQRRDGAAPRDGARGRGARAHRRAARQARRRAQRPRRRGAARRGRADAAEESLRRAREAMDSLHVDRAARESELAVARTSRDALGRDVRTREHELAGVQRAAEVARGARRRARRIRRRRAHHPRRVRRRRGRISDRSPTTSRSNQQFERAVDAALGELLQHVVVRTHEDAAAGLQFVRERAAGRVGFLVIGGIGADPSADTGRAPRARRA